MECKPCRFSTTFVVQPHWRKWRIWKLIRAQRNYNDVVIFSFRFVFLQGQSIPYWVVESVWYPGCLCKPSHLPMMPGNGCYWLWHSDYTAVIGHVIAISGYLINPWKVNRSSIGYQIRKHVKTFCFVRAGISEIEPWTIEDGDMVLLRNTAAVGGSKAVLPLVNGAKVAVVKRPKRTR